jgi:probable F420-dependent oxidoreductase
VASDVPGGTKPLAQLSIELRNWEATDPGSWQHKLDLACASDRAGIDRVVAADHIVFGERMEESRQRGGGVLNARKATVTDGPFLEPLTLLSVLAGLTSRIRLGTAVLLVPLRRPAVLAKQTATLDVLSGGRLDLGVGVGWQLDEYKATGVDFSRRGMILDHCLAVCQTLWTEPVASYRDSELAFERIHAMPKPLQPGGVPIWVGGRINPNTVRRLVRFGVGWIPWGECAADPGPGIAALRAALHASGRDPSSLQVVGTLPVVDHGGTIDLPATMDGVPALIEAGITDFRYRREWPRDLGELETLLTETVVAFREVVGCECRPPNAGNLPDV